MIEYRSPDQKHRTRAYVDNLFQMGRAIFVTLVSSEEGLAVYLNGRPARKFPGLHPPGRGLHGRLVIGTSPVQEDCWVGTLHGLAFYQSQLTPQRVFEHYRDWTESGEPALIRDDQPAALYLFDEHSGNMVHNRVGSGGNLYIPERFMLLHQKLLQPPWNEYYSGLGYWEDLAINVAGFVPLGFAFCAYWMLGCHMMKQAVLTTVLVGIASTLTIEILQSYLPTRQSGVTDLFSNTLGTWLGAVLYCWQPVRTLFTGTLSRLTAARAIA